MLIDELSNPNKFRELFSSLGKAAFDDLAKTIPKLLGPSNEDKFFKYRQLEMLLVLVADISETYSKEQMEIFTTSLKFIKSLISIIVQWNNASNKADDAIMQLHNCCHLAVFIILGMLNGSKLCLKFADVTTLYIISIY
jgi:hypothetical protein